MAKKKKKRQLALAKQRAFVRLASDMFSLVSGPLGALSLCSWLHYPTPDARHKSKHQREFNSECTFPTSQGFSQCAYSTPQTIQFKAP